MHPRDTLIGDFVGDTEEKDLARLVQDLTSLEKGERTVGALIQRGGPAIGPLKRFLFESKPGVAYQARRWAVEALAGIGAKDALIQFLKLQKNITDPAIRLSEEVVESVAAKALSAYQTNDAFETILDCALPRPRTGLIEALSVFANVEAVPYFITALADDICRPAAEKALRKLGSCAGVALLAAALTRIPPDGDEPATSLKRRITALEILRDLGPPPEFWAVLGPLINDSNSAVVIAVCNIAPQIGSIEAQRAAMSRLLAVLRSADWFAQGKIENCLMLLYATGKDILDEEIARRKAAPTEQRATDRVLRTLLRVRHHMNEALTA